MSAFKALSLTEQMAAVQAAILTPIDAYVKEIYPDHAIIEMGGSFWRVGYTITMGGDGAEKISIADYGTWAKVEREWAAAKSTQVSIKAITDTSITVAGYGVVFGGRDLEGETFGADTDYMLDLVPAKPIMYDHAQGQIKHIIGKSAHVVADEFGLFVEAELDRSAKYVEQIRELAEKGALGWSSGSVAHMTERLGATIKRWPVIEFSLTPTPAEPRTLGVEVIKYLAETNEAFGALLPEGDRTSPAQNADAELATALSIEIDLLEMEIDHEL